MIYAVKTFSLFLLALAYSFTICRNNAGTTNDTTQLLQEPSAGRLLKVSDVGLPVGFHRNYANGGSFGYWLRNIELKKNKTVYLYNGRPKLNQTAQYAVLNVSLSNENLQQCADAVMRLRAEFFYSKHQYDKILFYDNHQTPYEFTAPYDRNHFDKYLRKVFGMCGTASLSRQLKSKNIMAVEAGDILICGGFPGHAVIVMDVAKNSDGEKIFLLAQSYMPAQDVHLLKNPANDDSNPWYETTAGDIVTPEYIFKSTELKTW